MIEQLSSRGIITKSRAIYGKQLKQSDYDQLVRKNNISEICVYLKSNTHYSSVLASTNEDAIHRGQLETLLRKDNFDNYLRLVNFKNKRSKSFYAYRIKLMEIQQILDAIMHIITPGDSDFILTFPAFLMKHISIDLMKIAKSHTAEELLESLKNTPYLKLLQRQLSGGEISYTSCESVLYNYYYDFLLKQISIEFSGAEKKALEELILMFIDVKNIIIAYRMRVFFGESTGNIRMNLIPFHYRLSENSIERILSGTDNESVEKAIMELPYFRKFPITNNETIEYPSEKYLYTFFKRKLKLSTHASVVFYSLTQLMDIELENVTNIIEGIRYKIPISDIERLLLI